LDGDPAGAAGDGDVVWAGAATGVCLGFNLTIDHLFEHGVRPDEPKSKHFVGSP